MSVGVVENEVNFIVFDSNLMGGIKYLSMPTIDPVTLSSRKAKTASRSHDGSTTPSWTVS